MLRFLFGCSLAVVALARIDYVLAEDIKIDVDKLKKLVTPSPLHTRVVGGSVTTNAKLGGYIIQLYYMGDFICGGTLIHELIVLTAAHCFMGRPHIEDWMAVGGVSTLYEEGESRDIREILQPATFNSPAMHMDVALLKMVTPMKGKDIKTLALCTKPLKTGTVLTVSGWGMTHAEQIGPQKLLRTVNVPVIDKRTCRAAYRTASECLLSCSFQLFCPFYLFFKFFNITDNMICAGVLGSKDACLFDSGGPLVYQQEICGIVSFGIGCARKDYPGVYTDVKFMKPFIEQSIQDLLSRLE
ncbi:hypothetical protein KR059_002677 [Drosophila kikkawai]|nr:hypothetical protein KR059_002677 [Drosophila kikkawai]